MEFKKYNHLLEEKRISDYWIKTGCFKPKKGKFKNTFSIVIPPPNITGRLHMGHALNNSLQDVLIRFNRMKGVETLWQPGTDHAGILGVNKGQKEAAASIGLTKGQILKLVVMPQALRIIIPPTTNQYLNLTKNSSLAAAIAYPDIVLVFAGTALMQTGRAIEIISITMLTYLSLSLSISVFMNWYNKKMAIKEK